MPAEISAFVYSLLKMNVALITSDVLKVNQSTSALSNAEPPI